MNNEYLISIIVPVYNVEPFISECINSILIQSYKNFELILVNDGSTDNSPTICEQYASKDKRIKVIHKANGGLSDARNWGLKFSSGEYVVFLDSDDYWNDCDALFSLYSLLNKYSEVDVVFFRRFTFEENISQHIRYFPQFNLNKIT
jgi:glycosyltransferase involved in cell wall biosynthesis